MLVKDPTQAGTIPQVGVSNTGKTLNQTYGSTQTKNNPFGIPDVASMLPNTTFNTDFSINPNYLPANGYQAPNTSNSYQLQGYQKPQGLDMASYLAQATSAMNQGPQIQDYSGDIAQIGQNQVNTYLQGLQQPFQQQTQEMKESLAQRGIYGAGGGDELLMRLATEQNQQASQGIQEIMNQNALLQIDEKSRVRDLEQTKFQNLSQLAAETGLAEADIQSRYGMQLQELSVQQDLAAKDRELEAWYKSQQMNLEAAGLINEAKMMENEAKNYGLQAQFKQIDALVQQSQLRMDAQGVLTEQAKLDLEEFRIGMGALIDLSKTPGLSDEERAAILTAAEEMYNDGDFQGTLNLGTGGNAQGSGTQLYTEGQNQYYYDQYGNKIYVKRDAQATVQNQQNRQ